MKRIFQITAITLITAGYSYSASASVGIGFGVGVGTEIYRDYDTNVLPLPLINYDSDRFYIKGLGAGFYLFKDKSDQLSIGGYYMPLKYKPADSSDWQMKRLDKRKSTVMASLNYRHIEDWGIIRTSAAIDALDEHNGVLVDAAYLYPFKQGSSVITVGVGSTWASEKYHDYYFGVTADESNRSGLSRYSADHGFSPYVEMSFHNRIDEHWSLMVDTRVTKFSKEVKDSPMVDRSYNAVLFTGMNYSF